MCNKCVGKRGEWAGARRVGVKRKGRERIPRMTGKTLSDYFAGFLRIMLQEKWVGLGSSGSTSSSKGFASTQKL